MIEELEYSEEIKRFKENFNKDYIFEYDNKFIYYILDNNTTKSIFCSKE